MSEQKQNQRTVRCVVKTAAMEKSRVGLSVFRVKEDFCGKMVTKRTRIMFHDEKNVSRVGDEVLVTPCSPISGKKSYTLVEVVKKARG